MKRSALFASWVLFGFFGTAHSLADQFAIEDYGLLPNVRSFALSPDGEHITYIRRGEKGDYFVVSNLATNEIVGGANAEDIKARSIFFATNSKVILRGGKASRSHYWRYLYEHSAAVLYDMKTKRLRTLLKNLDNLHPSQTGLGAISGFDPDKNWLLMPAYINPTSPRYGLVRVNIDNGRARVIESGNRFVTEWFTDSQGHVIAKETFDANNKLHQVHAKDKNKWRLIREEKTDRPNITLSGVSPDGSKLIYTEHFSNEEAVFTLSLDDGTTDGPLYVEENSEIRHLITTGLNREFVGIRYTGLMDSSVYFDKNVNAQYAAVSRFFPGSSINRESATADGSKSIYLISGNDAANSYYLLDADTMDMRPLGSEYPNIDNQHIGEITAVRYKARDGLSIGAIVTWPVGIEKRKNLPLIVLPHGGPETYDCMEFDWWAQYLARSGYAVLQPNFRGSTGFGAVFRDAGRGQWGQTMQDDLTDGVAAMVDSGSVDPDRVCIMGSSYGGYSALAGATFTPEVYKCVVSAGGVSDLPRMLKDTSFKFGQRHWVVSYWRDVIGDADKDSEKLESISPVNFADRVIAPVLLIHGRDDSTIPIVQSNLMHKALLKAGKDVEMVSLKGEDHWLSSSDTRLRMLREITDFLNIHNPPGK